MASRAGAAAPEPVELEEDSTWRVIPGEIIATHVKAATSAAPFVLFHPTAPRLFVVQATADATCSIAEYDVSSGCRGATAELSLSPAAAELTPDGSRLMIFARASGLAVLSTSGLRLEALYELRSAKSDWTGVRFASSSGRQPIVYYAFPGAPTLRLVDTGVDLRTLVGAPGAGGGGAAAAASVSASAPAKAGAPPAPARKLRSENKVPIEAVAVHPADPNTLLLLLEDGTFAVGKSSNDGSKDGSGVLSLTFSRSLFPAGRGAGATIAVLPHPTKRPGCLAIVASERDGAAVLELESARDARAVAWLEYPPSGVRAGAGFALAGRAALVWARLPSGDASLTLAALDLVPSTGLVAPRPARALPRGAREALGARGAGAGAGLAALAGAAAAALRDGAVVACASQPGGALLAVVASEDVRASGGQAAGAAVSAARASSSAAVAAPARPPALATLRLVPPTDPRQALGALAALPATAPAALWSRADGVAVHALRLPGKAHALGRGRVVAVPLAGGPVTDAVKAPRVLARGAVPATAPEAAAFGAGRPAVAGPRALLRNAARSDARAAWALALGAGAAGAAAPASPGPAGAAGLAAPQSSDPCRVVLVGDADSAAGAAEAGAELPGRDAAFAGHADGALVTADVDGAGLALWDVDATLAAAAERAAAEREAAEAAAAAAASGGKASKEAKEVAAAATAAAAAASPAPYALVSTPGAPVRALFPGPPAFVPGPPEPKPSPPARTEGETGEGAGEGEGAVGEERDGSSAPTSSAGSVSSEASSVEPDVAEVAYRTALIRWELRDRARRELPPSVVALRGDGRLSLLALPGKPAAPGTAAAPRRAGRGDEGRARAAAPPARPARVLATLSLDPDEVLLSLSWQTLLDPSRDVDLDVDSAARGDDALAAAAEGPAGGAAGGAEPPSPGGSGGAEAAARAAEQILSAELPSKGAAREVSRPEDDAGAPGGSGPGSPRSPLGRGAARPPTDPRPVTAAVALVLTTRRVLLLDDRLAPVAVAAVPRGAGPLTSALWVGPSALVATRGGQLFAVRWDGSLEHLGSLPADGPRTLVGALPDRVVVAGRAGAGDDEASAGVAVAVRHLPAPRVVLAGWASLGSSRALRVPGGPARVAAHVRSLLASYGNLASSAGPAFLDRLAADGHPLAAASLAAARAASGRSGTTGAPPAAAAASLRAAAAAAAAALAGDWGPLEASLLDEARRAGPAPPPQGSSLRGRLVAAARAAEASGKFQTARRLLRAAGAWAELLSLGVFQGDFIGLAAEAREGGRAVSAFADQLLAVNEDSFRRVGGRALAPRFNGRPNSSDWAVGAAAPCVPAASPAGLPAVAASGAAPAAVASTSLSSGGPSAEELAEELGGRAVGAAAGMRALVEADEAAVPLAPLDLGSLASYGLGPAAGRLAPAGPGAGPAAMLARPSATPSRATSRVGVDAGSEDAASEPGLGERRWEVDSEPSVRGGGLNASPSSGALAQGADATPPGPPSAAATRPPAAGPAAAAARAAEPEGEEDDEDDFFSSDEDDAAPSGAGAGAGPRPWLAPSSAPSADGSSSAGDLLELSAASRGAGAPGAPQSSFGGSSKRFALNIRPASEAAAAPRVDLRSAMRGLTLGGGAAPGGADPAAASLSRGPTRTLSLRSDRSVASTAAAAPPPPEPAAPSDPFDFFAIPSGAPGAPAGAAPSVTALPQGSGLSVAPGWGAGPAASSPSVAFGPSSVPPARASQQAAPRSDLLAGWAEFESMLGGVGAAAAGAEGAAGAVPPRVPPLPPKADGLRLPPPVPSHPRSARLAGGRTGGEAALRVREASLDLAAGRWLEAAKKAAAVVSLARIDASDRAEAARTYAAARLLSSALAGSGLPGSAGIAQRPLSKPTAARAARFAAAVPLDQVAGLAVLEAAARVNMAAGNFGAASDLLSRLAVASSGAGAQRRLDAKGIQSLLARCDSKGNVDAYPYNEEDYEGFLVVLGEAGAPADVDDLVRAVVA